MGLWILKLWIVFGFGIVLETGLTLVLVNLKGLGDRGAEWTDGFKQIFASDVNNCFVALEIFWHMLDFRSSMSYFGLG